MIKKNIKVLYTLQITMSIFEILTFISKPQIQFTHVCATPQSAFAENVPMFDNPVYFMGIVQSHTC